MNTQGQVILSKNVLSKKESIDLSNNAKGIYFVTVTSENGVSTHKVTVQ
ncbi:MAG: T9SS type A sorting domain-containing protein [Vicingaceae bacterium]